MGRVDRRKLEREPEIRCALKHPPKSPNAEWYLYTKDWLALLRQFAPDRVGALEVLGRFESRVRNTAAHEIVSISEDRITMNRPGMSGDSSSWKGWGHVRWFIEEVPAGAA
ncbi:predicted protein [Mycobacterium tuberculosis 94_M4241A]|nr:predicted protein [Mycobacterium tuberculosis 94_M4241A]